MAKAERGEPQTPVPNFPMDDSVRDTRMNNQRVLMSEFDADIAAKRDRTKAREDEVKSLRFSWPTGNKLTKQVGINVEGNYSNLKKCKECKFDFC